MEEFPLQKLPNELLVRICELLTFEDFYSLTSSCQQLKKLASRNLWSMPKKEVQYLTIKCGSKVEVRVEGSKNLTVNSYDAAASYLSHLKITKGFIVVNFTPTLLKCIPTKVLLKDVEILELSDTVEATSVKAIVPLMKLLPKCNKLKFTDSCGIYGSLSSLLEHMDYCHSLCFNSTSLLKFDNRCLEIISSKSSPSNPLLLIFAVNLQQTSISLIALKNFLHTTHFCPYSLISISQLAATRHQLIIEFPSIQMHDSGNGIYDFEATITVPDGNVVRLQILELLGPPLALEEEE